MPLNTSSFVYLVFLEDKEQKEKQRRSRRGKQKKIIEKDNQHYQQQPQRNETMAVYRARNNSNPIITTVFFDLDNTLIETRKGDSLACKKVQSAFYM